MNIRWSAFAAVGLALAGGSLFVKSQFDSDMQRAHAHAAQGCVVVATPCGPIAYQASGTGMPLLVVHDRGGGLDQGMAFAGGLVSQCICVIAMSRSGYLRTPTPSVSARHDRYGTYASAQYTASHIAGAKFIGFDEGGYTWVGQDDEVMAASVQLLKPSARP